MRRLLLSSFILLLLSFIVPPNPEWKTDFQKAKEEATTNHKFILLNFSGSDWCGPCIRMHKEIFDNDAFNTFSNDKLILVNADFPRQKKNQLSKELQKQNDQLADKYNSAGNFPYTLLLDANGNVIKAWNGFYKDGVPALIDELKAAMNGSK